MTKITTCLWFEKDTEEAVNFYVDLFNQAGHGHSAKMGVMTHYDEASAKVSGQPEGSILTMTFELDGQEFMALNGGPQYKFSPATSFVINCETQEEIDYFWDKFNEGGKESQCGWIDDKFGITWQVVPTIMEKLLMDPLKSKAAMKAMLEMKKLDIAKLESAS